jgi:hypothetical protein
MLSACTGGSPARVDVDWVDNGTARANVDDASMIKIVPVTDSIQTNALGDEVYEAVRDLLEYARPKQCFIDEPSRPRKAKRRTPP